MAKSKNMGLVAARGNDICMNRYALHTYVHTVSSGKTRCVFSGPADRPRLHGIVWNRSFGFVAIRMDTTANLLDWEPRPGYVTRFGGTLAAGENVLREDHVVGFPPNPTAGMWTVVWTLRN